MRSEMPTFLSKIFSSKKKLKVEFCQNNLDQFVDEQSFPRYEEFFSSNRVEYKEYECLSECKTCRQSPYAKVDGQILTADTAFELLEKLKAHSQ